MGDLNYQDLSWAQTNPQQPGVRTIVAAAQIAPTTPLSIISGNTAVATIVPPISGVHMIAIVAGTTGAAFTTAGNIVGLTTGSTTQPNLFVYNPVTGQYLRVVVS